MQIYIHHQALHYQDKQDPDPQWEENAPGENLVLEPVPDSDEEDEEETCKSCARLKRRVRDLENQIKQFQGQGNTVIVSHFSGMGLNVA